MNGRPTTGRPVFRERPAALAGGGHAMPQTVPIFWLSQSEADVPAGDDWLAGEERAILERLTVPKRRADWRLGRWTAHRALAASPFVNPGSSVWVEAADDGAPEAVVDAARGRCAVSISHSGGRGVCAVAPPRVALGCDVEAIAPHTDEFVADYFTAHERTLVHCADEGDRSLLTTLVWSAKESALKALRQGLRLDTRTVSVCLPGMPVPGDWQALAVQYRAGPKLFHGWWRREGDHIVTVVASPRPCSPSPLDAER